MKRIAAFFASIITSISALCLAVGAEEAATDATGNTTDQAPLLQQLFEENGMIILAAALGVFAVVAIIMLAVTHSRSRKKHMAKREKRKQEAKIREMIEAKLAGKDIDEDDQCYDEDPYAAGYYDEYGYWHWNHPTYKTLENSAVNVPARDMNAVPELKEAKPEKQVKAVAMVQPVIVKDLVTVPRDCPKCKTVKLEDTKKDNSTAKKVAATVALTALGCHILSKLRK